MCDFIYRSFISSNVHSFVFRSNENLLRKYRLNLSEINGKKEDEIIDFIYEKVVQDYEE